jgi:hypothetical protein
VLVDNINAGVVSTLLVFSGELLSVTTNASNVPAVGRGADQRLKIPTSHQCVNVTLRGSFSDSVLPYDQANKLVVGLEHGKLLLGELAPLATDGVQHVVTFDVLLA